MPKTRAGWDLKRLAAALNYSSPCKATQGVQPAFYKINLLRILDPAATHADEADQLKRIPAADVAAAMKRMAALYEATDPEIDLLVRLHQGRVDAAELLQQR